MGDLRVEYRGMMLIVPESDSEWHGYFEAARAGRLVVRRCDDCGLLRYPPGAGCPWCGSLGWRWQPVSGRGTIYSYEIVVHAIQPGFRDFTPYPVVIVELDEQRGTPTPDDGVRLVANLVTHDFRPERESAVAIGARVEVVFQPIAPDFVLPQFRLSAEPASGRLWRMPAP
ncbi:MAG TPA: OB-fold domain-containing protein [Methylomirabilota bacterium]|nr:OB-fold domain-containing protein [Methylomirabilota bacterium]